MIQLIYTSSATPAFKEEMLKDILVKSRTNNTERDLTGLLVYHKGSFLQVLEGPDEEVEQLFDKIKEDERHKNSILILKTEVEEREFDSWSMGFVDISKVAEQLEGFMDYKTKFPLLIHDKTQAKQLLKAFHEGAWRKQVK